MMLKENMWLHFVGVGGIGMSALAQMCANANYKVTGSDRGSHLPENRRILDKLEAQGIKIYPQDGSYAQDGRADFLVYSTAIEEGNLDFEAGRSVERIHRSQLLAEMISHDNSSCSIAVTGSCGKSTVTAYLAEALRSLAHDPTCINGALVNAFRDDKRCGNFHAGSGDYLVFEADESDKSLVNYSPDYAIILNIGTDHYEKSELARVFATFLRKVKKGAVLERQVYEALKTDIPKELPIAIFESEIGAHGENAVKDYGKKVYVDSIFIDGKNAEIAKSGDRSTIENYGMNNLFNIYGMRIEDCRLEESVTVAEFNNGTAIALPQVGEHMALNALAIATLMEKMLGFGREDIAKALMTFSGVWRRFDFAGAMSSGALVFDDYAHNPEKIASAIEAAREVGNGKVWAVFQPHGYGPLGFMREELFVVLERILTRGDQFIMLEPFYAGGSSSFTPTAAEVIDEYSRRSRKKTFATVTNREALSLLLQESKVGDVVLIMGARDNSLSDYAVSLTC